MSARGISVYVNLCRSVYAFKFEIHCAVRGECGFFYVLDIGAGTAVVIVAAVLSVVAVPGVRNVDFGFTAVFGIYKLPA